MYAIYVQVYNLSRYYLDISSYPLVKELVLIPFEKVQLFVKKSLYKLFLMDDACVFLKNTII